MNLRYKILDILEGLWLGIEWRFLRLVLNVLPKYEPEDPELCEHQWLVDGTDYPTVSLVLKCYECNSIGLVEDPDSVEWENAFGAERKNYKWYDNARVTWLKQWDD